MIVEYDSGGACCRSFPSEDLKPLFYQSVENGIADQLSVRLHAHLLQNARTIGADCLVAQGEKVGYFADGLSRCNEAHHFEFPAGQTLVRWLVAVAPKVDHKLLSARAELTYLPPFTIFRTALRSSDRALSFVM